MGVLLERTASLKYIFIHYLSVVEVFRLFTYLKTLKISDWHLHQHSLPKLQLQLFPMNDYYTFIHTFVLHFSVCLQIGL